MVHPEAPQDLILIRHGRSEANELKHFFNPDRSHFITDEILDRHAEVHPLTAAGIDQAKAVGNWIATELMIVERVIPTRFYTSPLVRTEQTAGHLGMAIEAHHPDMQIEWVRDRNLREQQRGDIERMSSLPGFDSKQAERIISPTADIYRRSEGGESLYDTIERWETFRTRRVKELAGHVGIIVTHGYFMGAVQLAMEHNGTHDYHAWQQFDDRSVGNGNILHYSRRDPETGELADEIRWVRAIMPYDTEHGIRFDWREIAVTERPTSQQLVEANERFNQLLPPLSSV